jgi:hypothetical protein
MNDDHYATIGDAMREHTRNAGADRPDIAWILTPHDVWMANPHYTGPAVMHPDDAEQEEKNRYDDMLASQYEDDDMEEYPVPR